MTDDITKKIVAKYLRKGNMARCLRDILPSANLTKEKRETVAETIHTIVRWTKLYDHIMDNQGIEKTPEHYIQLAQSGAHNEHNSYPFEYQYSCSDYVAHLLNKKKEWAEYINTQPPATLCVNFNRSTISEVMTILKNENLSAEQSKLKTALRSTSLVRFSTVITNKYAHIMDENSQLIATITAELGNTIFDVCAGNGGKSLAIASLTKNTKTVHAYELNEKKRATIEKRCNEYNATITVEHTIPDQLFDVVLVDAPCTGIGAARRNPEAKYIKNAGDFPTIQLDILNNSTRNVKDDGYLIYAVCTFTPEETEQVTKNFLKEKTFKLVQTEHLPHTDLLNKTKHGAFTNIPYGDIFFIAVFKRIK
jgi:16S rRNA (cytosine967-C5)-methyltransferase